MRRPTDIDSLLRLAVDASRAGSEEFLARPGRRRAIEEAVFGPWQNSLCATPENRRMALLGAQEALKQYLYEEALVAMLKEKERNRP